ncbi:MAG: peptidoglycan-binding domain-containing protein [Chthoniobacterales bacterium]
MTSKWLFLLLLATNLVVMTTIFADDNVRAAQSRLQAAGFYDGKLSGNFDSETSAALTRYQIRHGLAINGRLDPATAQVLGVQPNEKPATPNAAAWRQLRQSDEKFLERLNNRAIPPPPITPTPPRAHAASTSIPRRTTKNATIDPHAPPPPPPENPPPAPPTPEPARSQAPAPTTKNSLSRERLRDYIAAFVLAGLDPKVGAELEFFADRVDYFGEGNVSRAKIRDDLIRYDQRWPERQFTLAGDLVITPQQNGRIEVTFPLRYELRGDRERASGLVRKTLTLQRTGRNDLEIVAVSEKKTSR